MNCFRFWKKRNGEMRDFQLQLCLNHAASCSMQSSSQSKNDLSFRWVWDSFQVHITLKYFRPVWVLFQVGLTDPLFFKQKKKRASHSRFNCFSPLLRVCKHPFYSFLNYSLWSAFLLFFMLDSSTGPLISKNIFTTFANSLTMFQKKGNCGKNVLFSLVT